MSYFSGFCLKTTSPEPGHVRPCWEPKGHDVGVDCTLHRTIFRGDEKFWPLPTPTTQSIERN